MRKMKPEYCGGSRSTTVDKKIVKKIEALGLEHQGSYQFTINIYGKEYDVDLSATDMNETKSIIMQTLKKVIDQLEFDVRRQVRQEIRNALGL